MNNQFDELTKSVAQSVTRRAALKKFGVGLAGIALACFGLANRARAATWNGYCQIEGYRQGWKGGGKKWFVTGRCIGVDASGNCSLGTSSACPPGDAEGTGKPATCLGYWNTRMPCSF